MKKYWVFKVIKIAVFVTLGLIVFGYVVMSLWNWLIPDIFHGPVINFKEAIGILILSKLLTGGFHGRCHGRGGWKDRKQSWKEKMEFYMSNMTPEEKEKFREKMKARCGGRWFDSESEKTDSANKT